MSKNDLLTFYLPILITVLLAGLFALRTKDYVVAFWRGLLTCVFLLGTYQFIKALIDAANNPVAQEADFIWGGLSGFLLGLLLGGVVGLCVGYAARAIIAGKKRRK